MEMCPICINEAAKKEFTGIVDGIVYYFCCKECENNFLAEPRRYVNCCAHSDKKNSHHKKGK
ncbi:hypothetical protein MNBD_UNCLBAC01-1059 [hydrothermal vent metagenome]|uniref:Uncharacterized protein n=1 Tax=hydrothermal vent metagenome TaxID=652676 RepID=A0A3B1D5D0_9ZZZZ